MRTLIVLVAFWLLPISAAATDLVLGAEVAVEWDDNVLSRSDDQLEDFAMRYGPRVALEDFEGRLRWNVRYNPDYRDFFDLDELDGWDHNARLVVDYDISPRTTIHFVDQYLDVAQFSRLTGQDPTLDVPLVAVDRQGLKRNQADFRIDHYLGTRHLLGFGLSNTDSDFEGERADTNFWQARLDYTYIYTARTRIGWIASAQQQQIDRPEVDTVETNYYNLSLQWVHDFDPTLSFSVSAGPALIDREANEQDIVFRGAALYPLQRSLGSLGPVAVSTCPTLEDGTPVFAVECDVIPFTAFADPSFLNETTDVALVGGFPDESTTDVTYFASVSVVKEWTKDFSTSLNYRRSAVSTGGQGGQVSDVVLGVVKWRPIARFNVVFSASWENREQPTEGVTFVRSLTADTVQGIPDVGRQAGLRAVPVDRDIRNVRLTATFSAQYQLTEQIGIFGRAFWYQQKLEDTAVETRKTTRLRIIFGVNYFFEPIGLPI